MKTKIGVAAAVGMLLTAFSAPAFAQCDAPVFISFNNPDVFASETAYNNATYMSFPGSVLTITGKVNCFGPPLSGLNANMPATEYMFIITGLVSQGTATLSALGTNYWNTQYNVPGSSWAVYEDATPDGIANNDGTVILSGQIDYFFVQITQKIATNQWAGSFNATYHATGGTLYGQVGNGVANLNGLWCSNGPAVTQCQLPPEYTAHPSGKFDQPGTTPSLPSTWGRIKLLYR